MDVATHVLEYATYLMKHQVLQGGPPFRRNRKARIRSNFRTLLEHGSIIHREPTDLARGTGREAFQGGAPPEHLVFYFNLCMFKKGCRLSDSVADP